MSTDNQQQQQPAQDAAQRAELPLHKGDLEPTEVHSDKVRGGLEPPSDLRATILPPNG